MKILHTIPKYFPHVSDGGALFSTHCLALAFGRLGHCVEVICANGSTGQGSSCVLDGVYINSLPLRGPFFLGFVGLRGMYRSIKASDLVVCQSVFNIFSFWVLLCCYVTKKPFVVSPRGMVDPSLIRARRRWLKLIWLFLASPFISRARFIHFTSLQEKRGWEACFEGSRWRFASLVIPNGVDPSPPLFDASYYSARLEVPEIENCGVYFGRFSWKKNLFLLLEAIALIEGLRFILVGYEEDITKQALQDYANALGISERIFVRDAIPVDQKFDFLRAVRFNTLISVNENFGNSIAESASVGTPVLVSRSVGAAELLSDSNLLFVWESDQPDDLVRQLRNIMGFRKSSAVQWGLPSWDEVAKEFSCSLRETNFK